MPDMWMDVDTALSEVPVNLVPLTDDGDFKSREESVAYNAAGLELIWHFTTTAGATSATVVTPTSGGAYDWTHQDGGMYTIEIPASGGASINNDTEGFGWFTGVATGILPWRGPVIGFRAAALNDALIDGGDSLDVHVTEIADDVITAAKFDDTVATDADVADVVLDELLSGHTTAGSLGEAISGILTDTNNLPDASAIKTALEGAGSHLALIKASTDKVATAMEQDGAVYRFTANALEQAPAGGGGGGGGASAEEVWEYAHRTLSSGGVTAISPVSADGEKVEIVAGYDYAAADGYALDWSAAHWPDLTGATVKLFIAQADGTAASVTGSVVSPGEPTQTVRFEPDATATAALDAGHHEYAIEATLANEHVVPLVLGVVHVLRDVR